MATITHRAALAAFFNGDELIAILPLLQWQVPIDPSVEAVMDYPPMICLSLRNDYDGSDDRYFVRDDQDARLLGGGEVRGSREPRLDPILLRDRQDDHDAQDDEQEDRARHGRAESEAAVDARLREVVADRRAERSRQDECHPERQNRVDAESEV